MSRHRISSSQPFLAFGRWSSLCVISDFGGVSARNGWSAFRVEGLVCSVFRWGLVVRWVLGSKGSGREKQRTSRAPGRDRRDKEPLRRARMVPKFAHWVGQCGKQTWTSQTGNSTQIIYTGFALARCVVNSNTPLAFACQSGWSLQSVLQV